MLSSLAFIAEVSSLEKRAKEDEQFQGQRAPTWATKIGWSLIATKSGHEVLERWKGLGGTLGC